MAKLMDVRCQWKCHGCRVSNDVDLLNILRGKDSQPISEDDCPLAQKSKSAGRLQDAWNYDAAIYPADDDHSTSTWLEYCTTARLLMNVEGEEMGLSAAGALHRYRWTFAP